MANVSNKPSRTMILAKEGEDFVAQWLMQQGYTILERNFRMRGGEIDIIAQHKITIAFIEVKTRNNAHFALSEIIVPAKKQNIINTAHYYMMTQSSCSEKNLRFDVALLTKQLHAFALEYIPNAFCPTYE